MFQILEITEIKWEGKQIIDPLKLGLFSTMDPYEYFRDHNLENTGKKQKIEMLENMHFNGKFLL